MVYIASEAFMTPEQKAAQYQGTRTMPAILTQSDHEAALAKIAAAMDDAEITPEIDALIDRVIQYEREIVE